jgi:hypothetical protein
VAAAAVVAVAVAAVDPLRLHKRFADCVVGESALYFDCPHTLLKIVRCNSRSGSFFHYRADIRAQAGIRKGLAEKAGCPLGKGMRVTLPAAHINKIMNLKPEQKREINMYRIKKQQLAAPMVIVIVCLAMAAAGFAADANSARIIPGGKVSIIKDSRVIGELSKEAPLPEGSLLKCDARCTVKTDDLYMVAEPETTFSVAPQATANELAVQQGTAYYALSQTSRALQVNTPPGNASIREFSVTDSELRGYVQVTGSKTEIGVIDGGTMTVATSSGDMLVTPGKQVTIAMVDSDPPAAETGGEGGGGGGTGLVTDIALGIAGTGVIVGGIYALAVTFDGGNGSNHKDGSPSSP